MSASSLQRWQELLARPLEFVAPERLSDCFVEGLPDEQLQALRDLPRFEERLLRVLMTHFHLTPLGRVATPEAQDLPILLLSPEAFARLPRLCGAIWHGATLSREIRSEVVTELRRLLGNDVFALALAHRQLAGAADLLREPSELLEAIERDGAVCVSAWLQSLPDALQGWLRLRLPVAPGEGGARLPRDIDIVRSIAAVLSPPNAIPSVAQHAEDLHR
jgi:hypothetical protein